MMGKLGRSVSDGTDTRILLKAAGSIRPNSSLVYNKAVEDTDPDGHFKAMTMEMPLLYLMDDYVGIGISLAKDVVEKDQYFWASIFGPKWCQRFCGGR